MLDELARLQANLTTLMPSSRFLAAALEERPETRQEIEAPRLWLLPWNEVLGFAVPMQKATNR